MESDVKEKRAIYIQTCMNLNQEFENLPLDSQMKLLRLYNGHYTGSHCWNFNGDMFRKLMNSYNVNVKVIVDLPHACHNWLIEQVSGFRHPRKEIYKRFIKFVNTLVTNKRSCIKSLFHSVCHDVRSHVGGNLRKILLDTEVLITPGVTSQSEIQHYAVYNVPENQEWRLGVLESMIQIKQDNWSVIFSDEEDEDLLEENDIDMMIYEVCTS